MARTYHQAELFENPNPLVKEIIGFIEARMGSGKDRKEVEEELLDKYGDITFVWFAQSYLSWKYPDDDETLMRAEAAVEASSKEERPWECILEFGNPDEDGGEGITVKVFPGGYRLYCNVDDSKAELPVKGVITNITPDRGGYLHIDLELPDIEEEGELHLTVGMEDREPKVHAWFDVNNIPLFRDGNRLHVAPIDIKKLLGDDFVVPDGEIAHIAIGIYRNDKKVGGHMIDIDGPWPPKVKPFDASRIKELSEGDDATKQMTLINDLPGWGNFKARMAEVVSRCEVGRLRKDAGLKANRPVLHTVIMGNPGTGKSSCVPFMASLYKSLGLLDSEETLVTSVSKLASSSVNGEYENTTSVIERAEGKTLIFENAHELYRTEKSNNYDTEQRIIRALTEALGKNDKKWMLVLVGEPDGLESVLAANPDLRKHLSAPIYMDDFKPEELDWMADACCNGRDLKLSAEARAKLEMYILHKYNHRGPGFQNAWMVQELFDNHIVPAMYRRLQGISYPMKTQLETVEAADIPMVSSTSGEAMAELDELIGLGKIKTKVKDYLHAVRLAGRRMEQGLPTNMPRLHMAFLGNPGTGKTTVAEIIGKVFASWGILSGGRVIRTEKSQMVGQYIGETEFKMRNLLERAHGNILFIDEAYQLVEGGEKDYGRIVMNSLLTELGKDNLDMVVILAGYTAPMKQLMESNEGIESRFPNVFNFEDYTTDELVEIGKLMICKQGFTLTPGAEANMRAIVEEESQKPSPRFGNGRYVSNLLQNEILATLGRRTAAIENPTKEELSTILPEDVVIGKAQKDVVFDDVAIDAALVRLDALAGLTGVKAAIHNFVKSARYLHDIGEPYVGKGLLSWRFIGKSGTGKSTVAEIMAAILKGMRLIANHHITEVKGERIFGVSEPECDAILRDAVKRSCNGLIFIDVDDPKWSDNRITYGRTIDQIRLKVKEMTVEVGGECALIVAELSAPNADVAEQLSDSGVYEFDHTLIFKDFTTEELYDILCQCLGKFNISFSPDAEKHIRGYLAALSTSMYASARTMKLMSRTIYQQVILREAGLSKRSAAHVVALEDVETFKWDGKKGKIGF